MGLGSLPLTTAAKHEVAPWIDRLARFGFATKGLLYMTIGVLAASAALGMGGKADPDSHTALVELFRAPFGRVLVGAIAVGLAGYAVWRVIQGIADPERHGTGAKGLALRASYIVRGLIHLGLALAAGALALWRENHGGGERTEQYTATALRWPGGVYLLWAIAGGLLGYGIWQLYCAVTTKLARELELGRVGATGRRAIIAVSRFGIAARGVVFCTIGVLVYRAARDHDPKEAGGLGDSMRELLTLGTWPYLTIALGLAAYGVYELINAKYRRIDVP